jgi:C-terminal processing protease CtpA/Prc
MVRETALLCFVLASMYVHAQQDSTRSQIVGSISRELRNSYVDHYMGQVMADSITALFDGGYYDGLIYSDEFVFALTETLRAISNDAHIAVRMRHPYTGTLRVHRSWKPRQLEQLRNRMYYRKYRRRTGKDMFDFGTVAILPGGLGYLELHSFGRTTSNRRYNRKNRVPWSRVVRKLKGTNALIVDLREHRGGYMDMEAMFLSSFIPERGLYLRTAEQWRNRGWGKLSESECYTRRYHSTGKHRLKTVNKEQTIALSSSHTISAGEWAAYGLQRRAHALIIGERTAGAGNGTNDGHSTSLVEIVVSVAFSFDEENRGFTIEGAGVTPDISTPADSALHVAYRKLGGQGALESAFDAAEYIHKPTAPDDAPLVIASAECALLCGDFRLVQVQCKDEGLYVSFDLGVPARVLRDETGRYKVSGVELIFLRESDGRACEVHIVYPDGYIEKYRRRTAVEVFDSE